MYYFLPFYHPPASPPPLTTQKIKFWKKWKKCLEILSLYTCLSKMKIIWYMIPEILSMPDRIFCHFEPFLLFYPTNNPKNQNFEKLKKMPWDIITLHKCAKNHNHMLYCSWDMACDRCNCYFSFWASFCPFTPRTTQKIKNLQKWKKCLKISSFYTSVPKIMSICYTAPEAWHVTHVIVIFFILGYFLPF